MALGRGRRRSGIAAARVTAAGITAAGITATGIAAAGVAAASITAAGVIAAASRIIVVLRHRAVAIAGNRQREDAYKTVTNQPIQHRHLLLVARVFSGQENAFQPGTKN
ncbi:MAG TPA: hypothetical protein VL172_17350 [Kofleriaceae bacterium]|nr:hypothetical protein [Kofleriaceae bacterium]